VIYDITVVIALLIFIKIGSSRGFIRSVYSMLSIAISALGIYYTNDLFVDYVAKSTIGEAIGTFFAGAGNEMIAEACSPAVVSIVSILILYFLVKYLLRLLITALDFIAKLPLLSTFNKLAGALFGALSGALWIIIITNIAYCFPEAREFVDASQIIPRFGYLFVK